MTLLLAVKYRQTVTASTHRMAAPSFYGFKKYFSMPMMSWLFGCAWYAMKKTVVTDDTPTVK